MSTFLSAEWLRDALDGLSSMNASVSGRRVVTYEHVDDDHRVVAHSQTWADGRLERWSLGACPDADAVVCCGLKAAQQWLSGRPVETSPLAVRDRDGWIWSLPPAPLDVAKTACASSLPGASLLVEVDWYDHPFGPTATSYRFTDGCINTDAVDNQSGLEDTVRLSLPFHPGTGYLLGGTPFRDVAARATASGNVFMLACLTGLVAPPGVDTRFAVMHSSLSHGTAAVAATTELRDKLGGLGDRT